MKDIEEETQSCITLLRAKAKVLAHRAEGYEKLADLLGNVFFTGKVEEEALRELITQAEE